jgi:hypothetical protein
METLFLLAFGEEDFLASLATAGSEAFFNKLLVALLDMSGLRLSGLSDLNFADLETCSVTGSLEKDFT